MTRKLSKECHLEPIRSVTLALPLSLLPCCSQFSLDAYNDLFLISIRNSPKSESLPERIKHLNDYHT